MNLEDQFLLMPFFDNFKKLISKIMLPNSIVLALLKNVFFLPNFVDPMKNLPLLMGLRNVETWILQFTNFL